MGTTFELWQAIKKKDQERNIDAAIKKAFDPKLITTATEATAAVLDSIDLANLPKTLNGYIDNRVTAGLDKLRRELKKSQRKDCSADAKNQVSTLTKNGTSCCY